MFVSVCFFNKGARLTKESPRDYKEKRKNEVERKRDLHSFKN